MSGTSAPDVAFLAPDDKGFAASARSVSGAIEHERLVMLLGAGVSHEAPSDLPLAGGLQQTLQNRIWEAGDLVLPHLRVGHHGIWFSRACSVVMRLFGPQDGTP